MKQYLTLSLIIIFLSLSIFSCAQSASEKPASVLSVELSEFKFNPSVMKVFAGREITINLLNKGSIEHDFTILREGVIAKIPFSHEQNSAEILAEYKIAPNQSGSYKITLPSAGEYAVICAIQGHMESGMIAKITAVNP